MLKVCTENWCVDERDNTSYPIGLEEVPGHLLEAKLTHQELAVVETLKGLHDSQELQFSARSIVSFVRSFGDELKRLVPEGDIFHCQMDLGGVIFSHVRIEFDGASWAPSNERTHKVVFLRHL